MARFEDPNISRRKIDELVPIWVERCLIEDGSLLFGEREVWTMANLVDFRERFLEGAIYKTEQSFEEKLAEQLNDASAEVRLLAAELIAVYCLFAYVLMGKDRKIHLIRFAAGDAWSDDSPGWPLLKDALGEGIGNPGLGYAIKRELQIGYLIDFAIRWKQLREEEQRRLVGDPRALREFADEETQGIANREMRNVLLHLIHPDSFERMSSGSHKRQIVAAFGPEFLTGDDVPEDLDERILYIREALEGLGVEGEPMLDFYRPPLNQIWRAEGPVEGLDDASLLVYKKQLVFYGPPGTSKTFQARELAETVIRREVLHLWGAAKYFGEEEKVAKLMDDNVTWIQLHPGFGYEEFIVGLRLQGDATIFVPGRLLKLVREMEAEGEDAPPRVLVLDEINRSDLSRMFGEAFSLLENRNASVVLPAEGENGEPIELRLPENLYVIGTMNLIDQSIEQLDFALRRRFFWRECGFEREPIVEVNRERWAEFSRHQRYGWDRAEADVERIAARAELLNAAIERSPHLGTQYALGHTYYFDIAFFAGGWLNNVGRLYGGPLWKKSGEPQPPLKELWALSLEPVLAQYLEGIDPQVAADELQALKATLFD